MYEPTALDQPSFAQTLVIKLNYFWQNFKYPDLPSIELFHINEVVWQLLEPTALDQPNFAQTLAITLNYFWQNFRHPLPLGIELFSYKKRSCMAASRTRGANWLNFNSDDGYSIKTNL